MDVARPVYAYGVKFDRSVQSKEKDRSKKYRRYAYAKVLENRKARLLRKGRSHEAVESEAKPKGRWLTMEEAKAKFPGAWASLN